MKRCIAVFLVFCTLFLTACSGTPSNQGGAGAPVPTIMTAVSERANEVDRMPLYSEVFGTALRTESSLSLPFMNASSRMSIISEGATWEGGRSEDPRDGIYYHESCLPDDFDPAIKGSQYDGYHHEFGFESIDRFAASIREMKDKALATCKVLDTWVAENPAFAIPCPPGLTPSHVNQRYRVSYDINSDVVTVESLIDESKRALHDYSRFIVSKTPEGKLKVDGYTANFGEGVVNSESFIRYLEGEYYVAAGKTYGEEYLAVTNFQTEEWVRIVPRYNSVEDQNGNLVTTVEGTEYTLYYKENGYLVELSSDECALYLPDGKRAVSWWGTSEFFVSLDFFDGWSQVESTEGNFLLTLSTKTGDHLFYPQIHHPNPEQLEGDGFYFNLTYQNGIIPHLFFKRSNALAQQGIEWTLADAERNFKALDGALGITPKKAHLSALLRAVETHKQHEQAFAFPIDVSGCVLSYEELLEVTEKLTVFDAASDDLVALKNAPTLAFDAQKPEYGYFEFLDFSLSGTATFGETEGVLDLSGVAATLSPSILLTEGKTYSLVFVFVSDSFRTGTNGKEAVYMGESMTIDGKLTLSSNHFPIGDGTYTLICYLADDADNRISTIMTVKGDHNGTYDLSTETRETVLTLSDTGVTVKSRLLPKEQ